MIICQLFKKTFYSVCKLKMKNKLSLLLLNPQFKRTLRDVGNHTTVFHIRHMLCTDSPIGLVVIGPS